MTWELVFYSDSNGREPVREWLDDLDDVKRAAAMRGLSVILAHLGPAVAGTEYGRWLSHGLFEFRLRIDAATILAKHDAQRPATDRGDRTCSEAVDGPQDEIPPWISIPILVGEPGARAVPAAPEPLTIWDIAHSLRTWNGEACGGDHGIEVC